MVRSLQSPAAKDKTIGTNEGSLALLLGVKFLKYLLERMFFLESLSSNDKINFRGAFMTIT